MIALIAFFAFAICAIVAYAIVAVGSGDPLPPDRPMWTVTPYEVEADVIVEGCGIDVAMPLLEMCKRDYPEERVVRLAYEGRTYVVTRTRRRASVREVV